MEEIVMELKRAAEAVEALVSKMEQQGEALMEKVEAQCGKLAEKIEKITAVAEDEEQSHPSRKECAQDGAPNVSPGVVSSRKTMSSFVAKIMAEAEGADPKQIDGMLNGLTVEQRVAVKMQMMRAGIL